MSKRPFENRRQKARRVRRHWQSVERRHAREKLRQMAILEETWEGQVCMQVERDDHAPMADDNNLASRCDREGAMMEAAEVAEVVVEDEDEDEDADDWCTVVPAMLLEEEERRRGVADPHHHHMGSASLAAGLGRWVRRVLPW